MDEPQHVGRVRRRWQLGVVAVLLVTLVGAVVWERRDDIASSRAVSAGANANPLPIFVAQVKINNTTLFLKNVQGLTIGSKVPGTGLTLSRGLTSDTFFADWMKQLRNFGPTAARRNITITFLDTSLNPERQVNVTSAVPVSLTLGPIDGTNPVLETLKLSYTDIAPA